MLNLGYQPRDYKFYKLLILDGFLAEQFHSKEICRSRDIDINSA